MSGDVGASSGYYGQPILKQPVWTWEIPAYFFAGGLAGASAGIAYGAHLRGEEVLARRAWLTAMTALSASPPLLISDLGRPERFIAMLRMFKVSSPMSVGSWVLSVSSTATGVAAANALTGRFLRRPALWARPIAALAGLPLSTYTGALLANTAVPVWHEARRTLPLVFASGAAVSAGGAVTAATPVGHAAIARRLALAGGLAELGTIQLMRSQLGRHAEVYKHGRAARYARISEACLVTGTAVLARWGRRSRTAAVLSGGLLCGGALATRWSVFHAGRQSATDPRYVIEPQRDRLAARP